MVPCTRLLFAVVIAGCTGAGCGRFDAQAGPPDDGGAPPSNVDAGASVDGSIAGDGSTEDSGPPGCRAPFSDTFDRELVAGPGWDRVPSGTVQGITHVLDGAVHPGNGKSLKVLVVPRAEGDNDYFEKRINAGACPVQVSFDLRVAKLPAEGDDVAFATIELQGPVGRGAVFLVLTKNGLVLVEQLDDSTKHELLPFSGIDLWEKVVFRYDPRPTPPIAEVVVGGAARVTYPTKIPGLGTPAAVRLGAAFARLDADAMFWIDNFAIE